MKQSKYIRLIFVFSLLAIFMNVYSQREIPFYNPIRFYNEVFVDDTLELSVALKFPDETVQTTAYDPGTRDSTAVANSTSKVVQVYKDTNKTYYDYADFTSADTVIWFLSNNLNDGDSITVLPAPGSGYAYKINQVTWVYRKGTVAYTGATYVQMSYYSNGSQVDKYAIQVARLGTTRGFIFAYPIEIFQVDENSPFWVKFDAGLTDGDGYLRVVVEYEKIRL